jgi:ACR3 family arsenite efflux pump ArsB
MPMPCAFVVITIPILLFMSFNSVIITNIREITLSPNRQNIKLRFSKVSNEVEIAMPWLIDDLNDLKENFPRTIIYYGVIM